MTASDPPPAAAQNRGLLAGGISLCAAVLFLLLLPVSFDVADDVGSQMILAGLDGFAATADVPFHSYALSQLLYYLYQLVPAVAWYGLLVMATTVVGCSLWLRILLDSQLSRVDRWICSPALLGLLAHCLYSPTFTSAALLCQLGAFLCLLHAPDRQLDDRANQLGLLGLLVLAALWRWQLVCYCLALLLPLVIARPQIWRLAAGLAVGTLIVVAADRAIHRQTHATPDWQQYEEFYQLRATFHDRPAGRDPNAAAFQAAAWTQDDYAMFRQLWVIHDDQLFNTNRLERFLAANQQGRAVSWQGLSARLLQTLRDNALSLRIIVPTLLALLLHQLASGGWQPSDVRRRYVLALFLASLPLLYLLYFRLVPRVAIPLLLFGVSLLLLLGQSHRRDKGHGSMRLPRYLVYLGVALAVTSTAWMVVQEIQQQRLAQQQLAQVDEALTRLAAEHPVATLLRMNTGGGLRHAAMHPLKFPAGFRKLRIIPAGWQTGSPRYQAILRELRVESGRQLLESAVASGEIVLVDFVEQPSQAAETRRLWESYYDRNLVLSTGTSIWLEPVIGSPEEPGLVVYRIRRH